MGAVIFRVDDQNNLTVSVGSFYSGDKVVGGMELEIGRFGSGLNEKYPTYYRGDGLGVNANSALSLYFASTADWLNYFPDGESYKTSRDGQKVKGVGTPKTTFAAGVWELDGGPCEECWYLNPPVFVFSE